MCSSSPPPAPDYAGAAQATAQGNLDAARAQAAANRVNQITPQGNINYAVTGQDPYGNPTWTATQTYSPDQQQIYQANTDLSKGLLGTAQSGLGKVNEMLSNPAIDQSKLAAMPTNPGESYTDAARRLMEPVQSRQNEQLRTQLANQGITMGSEAYNNALDDQAKQFSNADLQATMMGMDKNLTARQQGMQEQAYVNNYPLSVINALRTGNQVSGPQFTPVAQQSYAAGPDLLGAANSQYNAALGNTNAQNANNANTTAGVGTALGIAAMMF
ncbi:MAG TPA: hypothetical protein VIY48_04170 [Candidatus Paceibacterota bacterium]